MVGGAPAQLLAQAVAVERGVGGGPRRLLCGGTGDGGGARGGQGLRDLGGEQIAFGGEGRDLVAEHRDLRVRADLQDRRRDHRRERPGRRVEQRVEQIAVVERGRRSDRRRCGPHHVRRRGDLRGRPRRRSSWGQDLVQGHDEAFGDECPEVGLGSEDQEGPRWRTARQQILDQTHAGGRPPSHGRQAEPGPAHLGQGGHFGELGPQLPSWAARSSPHTASTPPGRSTRRASWISAARRSGASAS
jgi:hypothetical protein